ncbi:hypothetical protein [Clostridium arbusti]|uniref:hypothetical protein n=1 Tax=Clostridium arbusti TaxID=1137848 RepID=UPI0002895CF0|nr:hypothetical protein [Clostridium arbusti]
MVYRKGQTGSSLGSIENIGKKNRVYQRKGKANCTKCEYLEFGYYCRKKKKTPEWVKYNRRCREFKKI